MIVYFVFVCFTEATEDRIIRGLVLDVTNVLVRG